MTSLILVPRCHPLNIKPFSYYNIFSRDFCVYFYIFLRDFLYSCYIFPRDFLSKSIIKGDTYKTSTSQTAFGRPALLGREPFASLFRSRLWTIRLSWPGGSDKFSAILGRFYGPCPGLRDRCWVFSGKRCNLDIDCGYSVQAWPFSHRLHSARFPHQSVQAFISRTPGHRSHDTALLHNSVQSIFFHLYVMISFLDTVQIAVNRRLWYTQDLG